MRRKRVYFFNRFFWPDSSATAQILTDLCRGLDHERYTVIVVTSRLNYGDTGISYPAFETVEGIKVRRLWSSRFGRSSLPGRLLDYATIYLSFFLFMIGRLGPGDLAVFKTDPPLLSIPGAVARAIKGFDMVAWCQDLFPEVAISEIQFAVGTGWIFRLLAGVRDWSLSMADGIVVLGRDMSGFLAARGIAPDKLREISNWSVQGEESMVTEAALRDQWGIDRDTFVIGYSGNLGRAHDWETILQAAKRLRDENNLLFLLCGGGYGYEQLKRAVEDEGLERLFRFLPYQPLEQLGASLKVPDLHWFTLKETLTPFIFPSKYFGILQAARPLIFIGSTKGEIAGLIRSNRLGQAIPEGDGELLARTIQMMRKDRAGSIEAGGRARALWESRYQKATEIGKWEKLLSQFGAAGKEGRHA